MVRVNFNYIIFPAYSQSKSACIIALDNVGAPVWLSGRGRYYLADTLNWGYLL